MKKWKTTSKKMEDDLKKKKREDDLKKIKKWRQPKKENRKWPKQIWKTNQSTKINLIGCDTIVTSPSYTLVFVTIMPRHKIYASGKIKYFITLQLIHWFLFWSCPGHLCLGKIVRSTSCRSWWWSAARWQSTSGSSIKGRFSSNEFKQHSSQCKDYLQEISYKSFGFRWRHIKLY